MGLRLTQVSLQNPVDAETSRRRFGETVWDYLGLVRMSEVKLSGSRKSYEILKAGGSHFL